MKTLFWALFLWPLLSYCQLSITSTGTYTIDFDNTVADVNEGQFQGSGFIPTPGIGQLDSDAWRATGFNEGNGTFGGTHTSGDFARGAHNGGTNTGGVYAFQTATGDYCLGIQPTEDDFTSGDFTLRILNNSGNSITQLSIAYEIKVRNDQPRSNSFNFSWSVDDVNYTTVPILDYASPAAADPSPSWTTETRSTTLTGLNLANNAYLYLKWTGDDVSGSGNRDEFGLDDVVISGLVLPVQLVSFNATFEDGEVLLNWETASEIQNLEFQVEHREEGSKFAKIGSVAGNGTSLEQHYYEFRHTQPAKGLNYYRLKQVDINGDISYSPVVQVEVEDPTSPLVVYPTSEQSLTIQMPKPTDARTEAVLYNLSGSVVLQARIPPGVTKSELQIGLLRPGIYILQLRQRSKSHTTKVFVPHR